MHLKQQRACPKESGMEWHDKNDKSRHSTLKGRHTPVIDQPSKQVRGCHMCRLCHFSAKCMARRQRRSASSASSAPRPSSRILCAHTKRHGTEWHGVARNGTDKAPPPHPVKHALQALQALQQCDSRCTFRKRAGSTASVDFVVLGQ